MVKVNNVLLSLVALVSVGASESAYPGDSTHSLAPNAPAEPGSFDSLSPKNILKPTADAAQVDTKSPPPESSTPIDVAPVDIKDPSPESSSPIDESPEGSETAEKDNEITPDVQAPVDDAKTLDGQSSELIPDASGEDDYLSALGDIVKDNAVAIGAATLTAAFATWFFTPSEE